MEMCQGLKTRTRGLTRSASSFCQLDLHGQVAWDSAESGVKETKGFFFLLYSATSLVICDQRRLQKKKKNKRRTRGGEGNLHLPIVFISQASPMRLVRVSWGLARVPTSDLDRTPTWLWGCSVQFDSSESDRDSPIFQSMGCAKSWNSLEVWNLRDTTRRSVPIHWLDN